MSPRSRVLSLLAVISATGAAIASPEPPPAEDAPVRDPFEGNACIACHTDLPGRLSEVVTLEWRHSVHFAAGVSCDGCHGGDASLAPDAFATRDDWKAASHAQRDAQLLISRETDRGFVGTTRGREVSYFCGKCHSDIMQSHLGSPHGAFGDPTCLYCHGQGSHRIESPTLDIIDTRGRAESGRCSPCHTAGSMETVKRVKELLASTEERIEKSEALGHELEGWGYRNLELEALHDQAKQTRSQLRQVFHSFNLLEISNFVGEISETADRTETAHEMVSNLRSAKTRQTRDGAIAIALLLALAGLLVYYRHAFLHADHHSGSP